MFWRRQVAKAAAGGIKARVLPEINDIKVQLAEMRGEIKSARYARGRDQ